MEWVVSLAGGVIVTIVCGVAVWLWRRYHNPVVWTVEPRHGDTWELGRPSKRRAFCVTVIGMFVQAPDLEHRNAGPLGIDIRAGESRQLTGMVSGAGTNYQLNWVERDAWRSADFTVSTHTPRVEIRRRQVLRRTID